MLYEDYIMRQIHLLVQVLLRLVRLRRAGQYEQARAEVDQSLVQLFGVDSEALATLSEEALLDLLTMGESGAIARDRCIVGAALLRETAAAYTAQGQPEQGAEFYLRALYLLLSALLSDERFRPPAYAPSVDELVAALEGYILPPGTSLRLARYYERSGAFAQAEDVLLDMLDDNESNAELLAEGIAFYERLRRHSDVALDAGGLARDEVESGLAELQSKGESPSRTSL